MTTPVWTELVCARCACTTSGRYTFKGQVDVSGMKKDAKKEGWLFKHNEVFCSEYCVDKYLEEEGGPV